MRLILFFLIVLGTVSVLPVQAEVPDSVLYVNAKYDPARDPAKDLEVALKRAKAENKRVLLEVGGEWCTWCHALDKYLHANQGVTEALAASFVVVKVNYSEENENQAFLSKYPKIPGYPHIFVLEQDGSLLHSQNTGDLEEGKSYSHEAMTAFVDRWKPKK